jgi:hypothetical protein
MHSNGWSRARQIQAYKSMRIPPAKIKDYIKKYSAYSYDERLENRLKDQIQERFAQGKVYLSKEVFLQIASWKTARQRKNYEKNSFSLVSEVTGISFESKRNERLRIEILTLLQGVNYPVASTLLHFAFPGQYPILDFRTIWSLGMERPMPYSFDFWWSFVKTMRKESARLGISIRDLDKALWAFSK